MSIYSYICSSVNTEIKMTAFECLANNLLPAIIFYIALLCIYSLLYVFVSPFSCQRRYLWLLYVIANAFAMTTFIVLCTLFCVQFGWYRSEWKRDCDRNGERAKVQARERERENEWMSAKWKSTMRYNLEMLILFSRAWPIITDKFIKHANWKSMGHERNIWIRTSCITRFNRL